ncbi:hypothetical protein [Microbacterium istanbulense]|uniref:Uncharacterized protein n=1 Tax=Microbacterium istanbulense TaxID=3122049 RepID=A0ABU8LN05_9MICO
MNTDPLDALLSDSAPPSRELTTADVRTMLRESRIASAPPRRRRRILAFSAIGATVLAGAAGTAAANSSWIWADGHNPEWSYTYTAPTWGQCELRYGNLDTYNFWERAEVERIMDELFADPDLAATAAPLVAEYEEWWQQQALKDPALGEDPRKEDLIAWFANDAAVMDLIHEALLDNGYSPAEQQGVSGSTSQVHCDREDWGGPEDAG